MSEPIIMHCATPGCDYSYDQSSTASATIRCPKCWGGSFHTTVTVSNGPALEMVPRVEVDKLIAAAVALVVQKAAEHQPMVATANLDSYVWIYCSCGFNRDFDTRTEEPEAWSNHILALADSNALKEHDAALRERWLNAKMGCGHVQRYRTGPEGMTDDQWAAAECDECVACEYAKLEAENAGLRESLEWAVYALEHGSSVEVHWLKHVAKEPYERALARLGEAAGPEGRK